ncbi:MAG: VOC family protein [Candidatus Binatia bacterium]
MAIERLGHVGLWARDLRKMRDFYRDFVGLTVTDEDLDLGLCFLSSRPEEEHHELALIRVGFDGSEITNPTPVQQVSFRLETIEDLLRYQRKVDEQKVPIQRIVTHGYAIGLYVFDPEGNPVEFYYPTKIDARQPFLKPIDLHQSAEKVLSQVWTGTPGLPGPRIGPDGPAER